MGVWILADSPSDRTGGVLLLGSNGWVTFRIFVFSSALDAQIEVTENWVLNLGENIFMQ
jgi:hypothetical protein